MNIMPGPRPSLWRPARRHGAAVVLAMVVMAVVAASPAVAATGNIRPPFPTGEKWYVYQGYQSGTHAGGYALDLTTSTSATSTAGRRVLAPAGGQIYYYQASYGNLCVNMPDGRSYTLTHIDASVTSGTVQPGQMVGTVAAAGRANNNGVAHLHLGMWNQPNCYAAGTANEIPFDTAHHARMCGAPDMKSSGPSGGNGTWSGTYFTSQTCRSLTIHGKTDFNGDGKTDILRPDGKDHYVAWSGKLPWAKLNTSNTRLDILALG